MTAVWPEWDDPTLHLDRGTPVPGFVRLTGKDGVPGAGSPGDLTVWSADIDPNTNQPDITGLIRQGPSGAEITPQTGDWIITRDNGDLKLWRQGSATPVDLPDGAKGAPGQNVGGHHSHWLDPAVGVPSYASLRDRFVGYSFTVGDTYEVQP
jgi:hypothetical protein